MITFVKQYKAFAFGLLTIPFMYLLDVLGFIIIPKEWSMELVLIFAFWWLVPSLLIHHHSDDLKKKKLVKRVFILIILFGVTLTIDRQFNVPDNPLTIFLLTIFWLGVFHLFFPVFFKKFKWLIIGMYSCVFSYFTYVRLGSTSFEFYLAEEKVFAMDSFLFPLPILLITFAYEQWKWLKSLQADKTKAELELLKTQVNPHFFFNTLNNLYSLTVRNSEEAPAVILKLSDMMRYSIYEGKKEMVSLKSEVEYLHNYLDLHKIRYQKKVDIQFETELEGGEEVAPLLFIILLENALKHGVESLSDSAYLKMNLNSSGGMVKFTIENNFDPKAEKDEPGIGLENLKRRLALIYPKKHDFLISKTNDVFIAELIINPE